MRLRGNGLYRPVMPIAIAALSLLAGAGVSAAGDAEAAFLAENSAAMAKMMKAMDVRAAGDIDRDFVATMIPHHQGAIEMAQALLRHGRNEQLRRIAQEIIIEQTQEIQVMRKAIEDAGK